MKIAVMGAGGRMGRAIVRCAAARGDTVVAALEAAGSPAVGQDAGTAAGIAALGVRITATPESLPDVEAVIDFTLRQAAPGNAALAARHGCALVLGTTGLDESEAAAVRIAASVIPVVWAPNMSVGVNLLFAMCTKAARVFGDDYTVEVDETHHIHKLDAPSGTALRLGERVADGLGCRLKDRMVHVREDADPGERAGRIVMRSRRQGEVVGDHTVRFAHPFETVELTHHAWSRDAFALGALHAAGWAAGRAPGLYDMQDVLGLK